MKIELGGAVSGAVDKVVGLSGGCLLSMPGEIRRPCQIYLSLFSFLTVKKTKQVVHSTIFISTINFDLVRHSFGLCTTKLDIALTEHNLKIGKVRLGWFFRVGLG